MRFFSEDDFIGYQQFLLTTINEVISKMANEDQSIKVVLIGEFPDMQHRFVTVHPFSETTHIHHPEHDHFASLVLDLAPQGMNMFVVGVNGNGTVTRVEENN